MHHRLEAGCSIDLMAIVIVHSLFCHAGMKAHADTNRRLFGPGFGEERLLCLQSRSHSLIGGGKDGHKGIPDGLDDITLVVLDGGTQEGIMTGQRPGHQSGIVPPESGTSGNIGEEEGHGSARQIQSVPRLDQNDNALFTEKAGFSYRRMWTATVWTNRLSPTCCRW